MGRKIPMWQVGLVMLFAILMLCYAMNILGMLFGEALECGYEELTIPLLISTAVAALVAKANGYKWSYLEKGMVNTISRAMQALLILMVVGSLIGSWISAGVVPTMIYYGLMILSPGIFLFATCLICAIISLSLGSSWGTAGTVGIALIGIGMGLGMNPAITAGAVVSGAYFGDKMSPLSDTTNLAPAVSGTNLFDHIRHMVYTVTPSLIISLVIFLIFGFGGSGSGDLHTVSDYQAGIAETFTVSPVLLLPPLIVVVIIILKVPALPGLLCGVLVGCLLGSMYQGIHFGDWFSLLHYGFEYEAVEGGAAVMAGLEEDLDYLFSRGGMDSMMWTINLCIMALCFGGVLDASGMLHSLAEGMLKIVKGVGGLVATTVISCFFINFIASDQYLAIILPGRMFKEAFEDKRLKHVNLSRCLEGSGTVTSPLIPWNSCGATMGAFLGVSALQFARYAFFNWITPLVCILYGFIGFSMKKMTDEEYEKVLQEREEDKKAALATLEG